ncbi:putative reverse transcriptase domain-containing protein [Tanacetum coccineum]
MAASEPIINFSDSLDESVGSSALARLLLIAPVISSAAPMVETTLVASPTGLCGLVPYTGSDSDSPDEMTSPEHISPLPAILPFNMHDSFLRPDSSDGPPLQDPYVATLLVGRSGKRVGPLPARRLASRHASPRSPDHHSSSSSSSSDSSPVYSLVLDVSDQAHSGSSTRDVPPRLCYPPRGEHHDRYRDSSFMEASIEEDAEVGLTGTGLLWEVSIVMGDEVGDMPDGMDSPDSSGTRDGIVRDGCEAPGDQVDCSGDRARMAEMIYSLRLENLKVRAMLDIERDRVSSLRLHMSLSQEEFRQIRRDRDNARGRLRRTMTNTRSGMTHTAIEEMINQRVNAALEAHRVNQNLELRNGNDNGNRNGNANGNGNHGGNNGDRNENHNVNGRGDRNEIQKMETELWNLSVKNNDITSYTQRTYKPTRCCSNFQQLDGSKVEGLCCEEMQRNKRRLDNNYGNNMGPTTTPQTQNTARTGMLLESYGWWPLHHKMWEVQQATWTLPERCPPIKKPKTVETKQVFPDARRQSIALGGGDAKPRFNNVTDSSFFTVSSWYFIDSGADRSFVSNTFSALLDITPYALDVSYAIELADGRTSETNTVLMGCTLGLLGHPFNIDLMPIELGSFDVIIGMDWLAKNHAVIVCDEKIVRIPYGNEIWTVLKETKVPRRRNQITVKENKDKSNEKRLEDVPTVRDFPEVFPEDLPGLPPTRQVEFQIDLVPGAAPVARAPYRLAPSEMEELSTQFQRNFCKRFIRTSSHPGELAKAFTVILTKIESIHRIGDSPKTPTEFRQISRSLPVYTDDLSKDSPDRQAMTNAPILALPEGSENFVVYCDASHKGLGAVLMQKEKVIAYASRQDSNPT